MIEKLLRRFVPKRTEIVLLALERWEDTVGNWSDKLEIREMVDNIRSYGTRTDVFVLNAVINRLEKVRKKKAYEKRKERKRWYAEETAQKVLMGEKFDGPKIGNPAGQTAQPNTVTTTSGYIQSTGMYQYPNGYVYQSLNQGLLQQLLGQGQNPQK